MQITIVVVNIDLLHQVFQFSRHKTLRKHASLDSAILLMYLCCSWIIITGVNRFITQLFSWLELLVYLENINM